MVGTTGQLTPPRTEPVAASAASWPLVTVVVSTYNRPDTLVHSIRSVMCQTETRWAMLVVGDGCDARTAAALAPWAGDQRLAYVNLSLRCGEQALPNSAAVELVRTPFVALLNHDDLWLPDHLSQALQALTVSGADLYLGRALMCSADPPEDSARPVQPRVVRVSPAGRRLNEAFHLPFEWFEPASAWVMRAASARRVGPWHSASGLYRVPLQDWLLRAWRAGLRLADAPVVTCVKVDDHRLVPQGQQRYAAPAALHTALMDALEAVCACQTRVNADWPQAMGLDTDVGWRFHNSLIQRGGKLARWLERLLRLRVLGAAYRRHGWDAHALLCRLVNVRKGRWMQRQLQGRTGEARVVPPILAEVAEQLQNGLAAWPDWLGHVPDSLARPMCDDETGGPP